LDFIESLFDSVIDEVKSESFRVPDKYKQINDELGNIFFIQNLSLLFLHVLKNRLQLMI